ncbi:hypothetical protein FIBSPDRAFT_996556 [Athelia psychrophila]|uniref:Uncharacterized protein n=1 Tax=Athelia psychrophila TaxID=1759441 RepID=A0A165WTX0_9AGAM|nr:hypothetical protein FIBSPDRAFT_996556 [Fibularhizoctonia sp. CBS 109695]
MATGIATAIDIGSRTILPQISSNSLEGIQRKSDTSGLRFFSFYHDHDDIFAGARIGGVMEKNQAAEATQPWPRLHLTPDRKAAETRTRFASLDSSYGDIGQYRQQVDLAVLQICPLTQIAPGHDQVKLEIFGDPSCLHVRRGRAEEPLWVLQIVCALVFG